MSDEMCVVMIEDEMTLSINVNEPFAFIWWCLRDW
jgi:hypothetical protein